MKLALEGRASGVALALSVLVLACTMTPAAPELTTAIGWDGRGQWLKADTHVHTRFSDGSNTVDEVASRAVQYGVQVLAITDHSDKGVGTATPEYFAAIGEARKKYPDLIILAGLEWNLAPWGGDEHATVLVHPSAESRLTEFMASFDDLGRDEHRAELTVEGLRWLADKAVGEGIPPVVIYQHPSRKDARSMENVLDVRAWRDVNDLVVGFAGAPGHQRRNGSYDEEEKPMDRWDPAVARVGDAWDALLGADLDVWAADAPSDFHNDNPGDLHDHWPGEFSETWLYVPERSAAGVLRAYRSGRYFASHGGIVRDVELRVTAAGLPRPAGAGETITVSKGDAITADLTFKVPATALTEGTNRIDQVQIIFADSVGSGTVAEGVPASTGPAISHTMNAPERDFILRARGFRVLPGDQGRLAFYTNPIRVKVRR